MIEKSPANNSSTHRHWCVGLASATSCCALILLSGCGSDAEEPAPKPADGNDEQVVLPSGPPAWFADRVEDSGVAFMHDSGHTGVYAIPEITVGGVATLDYDGDGYFDLYMVQSGPLLTAADAAERPGNRLYRNLGDGTFEDVTASSRTGDVGYGCGAATGDIDNDGDTDLYVTNVGANVLYRNNGDGTFTNVSVEAGVDDDGFGSSATFVDYDIDGDLDLMVLNYLVWSPETERECTDDVGRSDYCAPVAYNAPALDVLYRNNGDGTFTDVSEASGIGLLPGTGLGVVAADYNGDHRIDFFVANDGYVDRLWIQNEDGTFEDRAMIFGCAVDLNGKPKAGMGVATMDGDDDGDLDLIICNLTTESDSFYRNMGNYFQDVTAREGLATKTRLHTRFGLGWLDFNNDGYLDLYHANGRVQRDRTRDEGVDQYAEPNLLHRGTPDGPFKAVEPAGGTATVLSATSRGAAFVDLNNDGGIDIVVANRDAPPHILMNQNPGGGQWIGFQVLDEHGSPAIGAVVTADVDERSVRRDVRTGYSYCAANDPRVHIGLGGSERVNAVTVRWPTGESETFGDFEAGAYWTLKRGEGEAVR